MSHQSYIKIRRQGDQRFFVGTYSLQVELILRLGTVVLNLRLLGKPIAAGLLALLRFSLFQIYQGLWLLRDERPLVFCILLSSFFLCLAILGAVNIYLLVIYWLLVLSGGQVTFKK